MPGTVHAAHRPLTAGRAGRGSGETADRGDILELDRQPIERGVLEEESKLTASPAPRRKDVVRPGPVRPIESSLPGHRHRRSRGRNAAELHESVGVVAQRGLRSLRLDDSRLRDEMP